MTPLTGLSEVKDRLRCGETFAGQLVSSGRLPAVKVGRKWLIREDDLEAYLATAGRRRRRRAA